MSIALYGGSFDPIHIGHLITAETALETYNLEKIIFIPSYITPLKGRELEASDKNRFEMTKLSTKDNFKFEVSDYEISNEGISYSYNTVKYFSELYKNKKIYFIIGTDSSSILYHFFKSFALSVPIIK